MMLQKKIGSIDFKVMDPKTIRKMSAIEIKAADTYDKDGYPMEEGLMDPHLGVINPGLRCKTCGQKMKQCPGHFGSFELVRPVVHAKFSKKVEELLHCTCRGCGRILLEETAIEELLKKISKPFDFTKKIKAKTKNAKKCPHCGVPRDKISLDKPTNFYIEKNRFYPTEIRDWLEKIPDKDLPLFGVDPKLLRPEWFVLTVVSVPPITIRPSITLETGVKSEDDLTHKLVDIIRINARLKDNIDAGAPQLIIEDLWDLLQYHVTTYFDNQMAGVPPAKHRSGRPLRTITQRLKGKKGRFRHNLTGKRVNYAARSTISPDPYISINEVGVPAEIADELTVPERVTEWNKKRIIESVLKSGKIITVARPDGTRKRITEETRADIAKEIEVGYRVERKLQDGDIVLFNRQPSLHRLSMLAHKARIHPEKTLKMNPIVCKPYNADFDGDEMNLHVPQTEEGQAEAKELMFVQNQIISPRYGAPIITLDEDGISGAYVLTMDQTEFDKEKAFQYFYELNMKDFPKPDRGSKYSGKLIFSQMLPADLTLSYKSRMCDTMAHSDPHYKCGGDKCKYCVKIVKGKLVSGVIDDNSLGEGRGKLADVLTRKYPPEIVTEFYDKMSRIVSDLLTTRGITVGLDEYEVSDNIRKLKEEALKEVQKRGDEIVKKYEDKKLQLIPGRGLDESFEIYLLRLTSEIKSKVEKTLLREKLENVLKDKPQYNTSVMIVSGSRGSSANLMNIGGFWGQASVREGRPKRGFYHRLISQNKKGDVGVVAGGFIPSNFMDGMNGTEYFYHAIGGRQGEVDTGVSTKVSGYLYRRLANSLKDISVSKDGTVRTSGHKVIQYIYGEDGVFPMNSRKGKTIDLDGIIEEALNASK
jgi:DNA-directed RNA polymerase subunit A'